MGRRISNLPAIWKNIVRILFFSCPNLQRKKVVANCQRGLARHSCSIVLMVLVKSAWYFNVALFIGKFFIVVIV